MMSKPTALLIFAQTAAKDAEQKPVLSKKHNSPLFEQLNAQTAALVDAAKMDAFWYTEKQQKGQNFGARITHALSEVFDQGFENIIVIGNDCPDLAAADILLARAQLQTKQLVLGPDHRGGAYLIGISKNLFRQEEFKEVSWQSDKALEALVALTHTSNQFVLSAKYDLNTSADAAALVQISTLFRSILALLISVVKGFKTGLSNVYTTILAQTRSLRAPPFSF